MKNKRGGLIITLLFVFLVLIVIGVVWLIRYLDVDTSVNVDLSKKEAFESEARYCINEGYFYELRINESTDKLYGVCIDGLGNECLSGDYYQDKCELTSE